MRDCIIALDLSNYRTVTQTDLTFNSQAQPVSSRAGLAIVMADFRTVAEQFTTFYYNTFDADRKGLAALYRDGSMLTFETAAIRGVSDIIKQLTTLPFEKVVHKVNTLDAQPSNEQGGILVMVTGALLVDEEQRPMNYTQAFQLLPDGQSYYVYNDVFRLIYG
ncbi:MAG: Nuclear transport factor 2 [Heterodermia speciosa]|uniref:Nuclear transport factor 2 n=1 Tax=Heterodermia speciosa TaxID=116794 RepID=A0A8H3F9M8_9LECA|nr:MAG: Nuclear transport factor 2 [Heterodermia speciosa]